MQSTKPTRETENSYEQLVKRVQRIISSPRSQLDHQANLARGANESTQDWERLLEDISDADGVRLIRRADGTVSVAWFIERDEFPDSM